VLTLRGQAMIRVIFNQKGGVGKSTITCNLAAVSADSGKRTLVVDLDPQGNSTHYLLGDAVDKMDASNTLVGFYEQVLNFVLRPKDTESYIHQTPFKNLFILPAHPGLSEIGDKLESRYKMFKLRDELAKLEGYDAVYIDTPPALNFFSRSALIAADTCLIPFDCDDFSRRAIYSLLGCVQEIHDDHNPNLVVEGIVVNQFQARANLPARLVKELLEEKLPILEPYLSSSVKIRESHQMAKPMIHLSPKHKLTRELKELYRGLI
jgi:chromosome partitioning protein